MKEVDIGTCVLHYDVVLSQLRHKDTNFCSFFYALLLQFYLSSFKIVNKFDNHGIKKTFLWKLAVD